MAAANNRRYYEAGRRWFTWDQILEDRDLLAASISPLQLWATLPTEAQLMQMMMVAPGQQAQTPDNQEAQDQNMLGTQEEQQIPEAVTQIPEALSQMPESLPHIP